MAKLEEMVTPTELLSAIKEGAMKQELVKKYKASEQELAMMLLPLYRRGELTKEEFNDFFKGASLRKTEETAEAALPKVEDDPPSEILKSLSKIFGKKSQDVKQPAEEEAPPPSPAPESKEVEAAATEVVADAITEPAPETTAEVAAQSAPDFATDFATDFEQEAVFEKAPESAGERGADEELPIAEEPAVELLTEIEAKAVEEYAGEDFGGMDSAGISDLLNSIFAKLNSIDHRLTAIEKKVLSE